MSLQKLKEVSDEIHSAKAKLASFAKEQGKSAVGSAFANCFAGDSKLVRIEWRQYTTYFNDGDPCNFHVHEPSFFVADDGAEVEIDLYDFRRDRSSQYYNKAADVLGEATKAKCLEVWDMVNHEEILEAVFGDHVKISISKNEVIVEEYTDHD